jgi:hypothetical protein
MENLIASEHVPEGVHQEYCYEEIPFDEWISEYDEAGITLFHDMKERACHYGLPLADACHVTDFLYFLYTNSSSKYKKVPIDIYLDDE